MKERLVYHVAPDKNLDRWAVLKEGREGRKVPKAKGLSKGEALKIARRIVEKQARPAMVLVHKTRYIIERQLQISS